MKDQVCSSQRMAGSGSDDIAIQGFSPNDKIDCSEKSSQAIPKKVNITDFGYLLNRIVSNILIFLTIGNKGVEYAAGFLTPPEGNEVNNALL